MVNDVSGSFTGPYPTVAATPGAHVGEYGAFETGRPGEAAAGYTGGLPSVSGTPGGHTDVGPVGAGGVDDTSAGSTLTVPSVNSEGHQETQPVGLGGLDETAAGYLGSLPSLPSNPTPDSALTETPIRGGLTSGSRTGALPEVAATPNPLTYKPLHT